MPKVSVIIPVYGVERYIERCCRSLFSQTIEDIEFIFVDDCTTDNSVELIYSVLKEYPNRKNQVNIYHHTKNEGLPAARQTGLKHAVGEYVVHCDADDRVAPTMYEEMYNNGKINNSDIIICDYYRESIGTITRCKACKTYSTNAKDFIPLLFSSDIPFMVWNKMIKKTVYENNIHYPSATHAEDMALVIQLFYFAQKITYVPQPFYYYQVNSQTAIHVNSDENLLIKFDAVEANIRLLEGCLPVASEMAFTNGIKNLKLAQKCRVFALSDRNRILNRWNSTYPEIKLSILFNRSIRFKHKIKYLITLIRIKYLSLSL